MWRFSPRGRITVTPVFLLGRHFTPETSTPLSDKRSTQNFPRGSPPMQEVKPTRLPRRAILWAKIAEELPRVIAKSLARSSLSGSSTGGRPYRIKSQFSSPRTLMSKRFTPQSPFSTTVLRERLAQCVKHPPAQCGRGMPRGNSMFRKQPRALGFARTKGRLRQRRLIPQEPHHRSRPLIFREE